LAASTGKTHVLVAAAGPPRPQVLSISSRIASAAMVPVNGRPILGWILHELAVQLFSDITILTLIGDDQVKDYVDRAFKRHTPAISCLAVEEPETPLGLAHTLYKGLAETSAAEEVLVILGHTICFDDLRGEGDWVLYGHVAEEVSRWCYLEADSDGRIERFIEKPDGLQATDKALIGVYRFHDARFLTRCLKKAVHGGKRKAPPGVPFSKALDLYRRRFPVQAVAAQRWLDCGSITGIHRSKRVLISSRSFNSVTVDEEFGIVTKRSERSNKLHQEHSWYVSLPDTLKVLAPRVLGYRPKHIDDSAAEDREPWAEIRLEYYGYSSLSEAWVYQNLHEGVWESIVRHLLEITKRFREYRSFLPPEDFESMYCGKTVRRLAELVDLPGEIPWSALLAYRRLSVNGCEMEGYPALQEGILQRVAGLYDKDHTTIIHGDFHLGNILYDVHSRLVKLVDARGNFGSGGIFGDCKYDLAKLRHSISGGYDLIVNDLFQVERDDDELHLELSPLPHQEHVVRFLDDQIASAGFSVEDVKLIEGLLFLSMLPLHRDHPNRQLAMFTRSLMILHEVFNPGDSCP